METSASTFDGLFPPSRVKTEIFGHFSMATTGGGDAVVVLIEFVRRKNSALLVGFFN